MKLVLVTRRGCHLCDQALELLRQLGQEPELVDVDADNRLHDQYDWRVPVILDGERVLAEGKLDRERLRQLLGRGRDEAEPAARRNASDKQGSRSHRGSSR